MLSTSLTLAVICYLCFSIYGYFRMKFSARSFTADCLKYRCTTMQYIGELCRYLINAPANSDDSKVKLKAVMGNGMRPEVWVQFQARYL